MVASNNVIATTRRIKSISIPAVPLMINHEGSQRFTPHKVNIADIDPDKLNNLESQNEIIYEPSL